MLLTAHTIAGMALGRALGNFPPEVAFVAGWVSHYMLDAIPHSDQLIGKEIPTTSNWSIREYPKRLLTSAVIDVVVAITLLILISRQTTSYSHSPIFWGGVGAMIPDILDNVPFWSSITRNRRPFSLEYAVHRWWHVGKWQRSWPRWTRFATQFVIIVVSVWILF